MPTELTQQQIDGFAEEWRALRKLREYGAEQFDKKFADLKSRMEAALKPEPAKCEDFGEPWVLNESEHMLDRYGCGATGSSPKRRRRASACVNAMQGIERPAEWVEAVKALIKHCQSVAPSIRAEFDSGLWLPKLDSLAAQARSGA